MFICHNYVTELYDTQNTAYNDTDSEMVVVPIGVQNC